MSTAAPLEAPDASDAHPGGERRLVVGGGRAPGFPRLRPNDVSINIDPDAQPDVVADIARAPFPDASFDSVYGEALPYPVFTRGGVAVAREMARLVRDGGRFALTTGVAAPVGRLVLDLESGGFSAIRITRRATLRIAARVVRAGRTRTIPSGRVPAELDLYQPERIEAPQALRDGIDAITPSTAHELGSLAVLRSFVTRAFAARQIGRNPADVIDAVLEKADELARGPRAHHPKEIAWLAETATFWAIEDEIALDPLRQARMPIAHRLQLDGMRDYGIDLRPTAVPVRVADLRVLERVARQSGMTAAQVLASGIEVLTRLEGERRHGRSIQTGRWNPAQSAWQGSGHTLSISPRDAAGKDAVEVPVRVDRYLATDIVRLARRQRLQPVGVTASAVAALESILTISRSGRAAVAVRETATIPLFQRVARHAAARDVG